MIARRFGLAATPGARNFACPGPELKSATAAHVVSFERRGTKTTRNCLQDVRVSQAKNGENHV
jgi:hypothetical protein